MSYEGNYWAWSMGVKPSYCKQVLTLLGDCHNGETGQCNPSNAYIVEFTGLDRKTVIDAIQMLELMGLIRVARRRGKSTQYDLLIEDNPVPPRQPGVRRKAVRIKPVSKANLARIRANPQAGQPVHGSTAEGTTTPPVHGLTPGPSTGHEPISNLQSEPISNSTNVELAADAAKPVDNSLKALGLDYNSPDAGKAIFYRGLNFLTQYPGITTDRARACLAKWRRERGDGRTLDAIIVAILSRPASDPVAFIEAVLARQPRPLDVGWKPSEAAVAQLQGEGMPLSLINDAVDVFVAWMAGTEVFHSDFPGLFLDWVRRDWEQAQRQIFEYRRRLAESAGFEHINPFQEPA